MMMLFSLLPLLILRASSSPRPQLEAVLEELGSRVRQQYGANLTAVMEAFVCHEDPATSGLGCWEQMPMKSLAEANFMRAAFTPSGLTAPHVLAYVNLAEFPNGTEMVYSHKSFNGNARPGPFPPASNLTFESALLKMRGFLPSATLLHQVTWRQPLHPCVSEDLFQFVLAENPAHDDFIVSIGVNTLNVCYGDVTERIEGREWCDPPQCFALQQSLTIPTALPKMLPFLVGLMIFA
jgi:hypothetical protein